MGGEKSVKWTWLKQCQYKIQTEKTDWEKNEQSISTFWPNACAIGILERKREDKKIYLNNAEMFQNLWRL